MGKFCVAGYCSNSSKDGVSLHRFPKTEPYRTLWTRAVRNTRKDWLRPTNYSFLCSAHFTDNCFLEFVGTKFQDFGLSPHKLRRLKPDAVPTVFGVSESTAVSEPGPSASGTSEVGAGPSFPGPSTSTSREADVGERPTSQPSGEATFVWEGSVKKRKVGAAFKKREHSRVSTRMNCTTVRLG